MADNLESTSTEHLFERDQLTAIEEVGRFVTRVWEHPLLDSQTRQHREVAKTKLEKFAESFGIDKSTFFTIPVGSLVWATESESDFEYIMIFDTEESFITSRKAFYANGEEYFEKKKEAEKIHILGNSGFLIGNLIPHDNYFDYLFTPDEYIGGNIELARMTRLSIIKEMERGDWSEEKWKKVMDMQFDAGIRKWDDNTVPLAHRYRGFSIGKDRRSRISSRLEKRANQTRVPISYKEAFNNARENISIPSLQTYNEAIHATKGAISILNRYVAEGIKD